MDQKNYSESMRYANESLRLARKIGSIGEEISALGQIATASGYMHDYETEARTFEAIRDTHSRRGDHGSSMAASLALAGTSRSRNRPEEAWKNLNDARLVLERIRGDAATVAEQFVGPADAVFAIPLAQLAQQFPMYRDRAFAATDSIRGAFLSSGPSDHYSELRAALGDEASIVEFVAQPQHNESEYVWLAAKAQVHALQTNHFKATLGTLEAAVASLSDPKAALARSLESRKLLAQVYLAPLKGKLRTKQIVIVPDESMVRIPFALLPHPDYDDGSLLGDHHIVTYAPSGQAIASRPKETQRTVDERVLLAGDPVTNLRDSRIWSKSTTAPQPDDWTATARAAGVLVDGSQLARLGFAKQETDSIAKELGNRKVTKLLGFDASREQVLSALPQADYIHLISHGLADLQRPRGSGLAFSFWDREGAAQNGFLRFEEIASMKIHAKIVTLSACDTSVGKVLSHYGVPSLSNAFLRAGARRVVSTLWKVDDAATAALMAHFYRNLFTNKMLPGEALWQAQKEIRKQPRWSNPYYWAGFTLSGDWRPL